ncbi:MAG TPA: carboxypeptidase-like regulatory domain-containing protein [Bryobacteraceae bacterium]|jgi:protocatechuate 3,4-dioxygenase beta subunit|nr:carboxypeptidase-like regulatory domain-containing protein [Bryobacteraceae bacterium]
MRIWLLTAVALAAQEHPAEPPKTGTVTGIVIDDKSGDGVPKAVIILRQGQQGDGGIGTTTGLDGKFALREVNPGTYALAIDRDGYVAARGNSQTVTVQAGQTSSDVKLKLLRTAAISGRILDPDGDPVSGVSVNVSAARARKDARPTGYATTNDRGEYRAFQIAPGEYRLSVTYNPRGRLEGVHMQPTGKADSTAGEAYPTLYYPGTMDARQAAVVKVEPGADLQGFDLQLVRMHGVRVRGRVITGAATTPAPLFQMVTLTPVGQRDPPAQSHDFLIRDRKGEFEFQDVLPGTYRVQVQVGGFNEPNRTSARQTLEIGVSDVEGIVLTPGQPRNLSGRVIPPEGRKVPPGLMVVLGSREAGDTQGGGFAQVGADGAFTMPQVAPNDYDLLLGSTTGGEDDAYIQAIRMGDTDALAEGVHVGEGPVAPIEIILKGNGGTAECVVTDDSSDPVPGATVLLVPDQPRQRQAALFGECRTRPDGTCKVTGITPGEYHVYAFPDGMQIERRDPDAFKPFEKYSEGLKFAEGERKEVSLKAAPAE